MFVGIFAASFTLCQKATNTRYGCYFANTPKALAIALFANALAYFPFAQTPIA